MPLFIRSKVPGSGTSSFEALANIAIYEAVETDRLTCVGGGADPESGSPLPLTVSQYLSMALKTGWEILRDSRTRVSDGLACPLGVKLL